MTYFTSPLQPDDLLLAARDSLSRENQQIRPARLNHQEAKSEQYSILLQKLDSKLSAREMLESYSM
ncbi:hypothetical protein [Pseudomonas folii]|uniref:Uncharacterized protein n=1 Tax=Pseudomonas folii TaxID=2762593 RepID=A0ABR7AW87_9PSED|nr:hypothetical protein [Pseudomonas folii]MBC3949193.1 hypothetical protein [Pseudomonas folii]